MNALTKSVCPDLKLLARGKVRDIYQVDARHLLFVATDRISAFDVVMANGIPGKGKILNQMSLFWFTVLKEVCPNHVAEFVFDRMPAVVRQYRTQLEGRSILVRKLRILPVEAIVRGYLAGSGWKEYRASGTVCGLPLPLGLVESSALPRPLYTPSTKAALGTHDENISPARAAELLGASHARIIVRHILPNAVSAIIVAATLRVASSIITESGLSFLGFGVQPPTPTWGNMLKNAQDQMITAPWTAIFPGVFIFITVIAINYIGDGLRDALDPRIRGR